MKGKKFLAPVVLMMGIGFIVLGIGHTALAQTTSGQNSQIRKIDNNTIKKESINKTQTKPSLKKAKKTKKSHISKKTAPKKHLHKTLAASKKHNKIRHAKHVRKSPKHIHAKIKPIDTYIDDVSSTENETEENVNPSSLEDPLNLNIGVTNSDLDELTTKILATAYSNIGRPYRFGGTTPKGFDCSGFVRYVFNENGISIGRSSRDQALEGKQVPLSELKPGDLIFFSMNRKNRSWIDHVGLYVGNGQFIHAVSRHSREIKLEGLENSRYLRKVVEARRIIDYTR